MTPEPLPRPCKCEQHADGSQTWVRACPEHGESAMLERLLPIGTPIRDVRHPELTGRISAHEWARPGELSAIPYSVEWDDDGRASDVLGWFYNYAGIDSVEEASTVAS